MNTETVMPGFDAGAFLNELRACIHEGADVEPADSPWKPVKWWAKTWGVSVCQADRYLKAGIAAKRVESKDGWLIFGCGRRKVALYKPIEAR